MLLCAATFFGACASNPLASRRVEGTEALTLTQGQPKSVALHAIASDSNNHSEQEVVWVDQSRQRAVPARIFLPKQLAQGPAGLVIFSHGLGGSRLTYSQLGKHWASQGFISIHLQHAGSDRAIWASGGLDALWALRAAANLENAIARAKDVHFALDQMAKEPGLAGRIDMERVAVAGHSFGANTALLVAGASFMHGGKMVTFADARIKSAIMLSPPSLPDDQDPFEVYKTIRIPTLHLTGTRDDTPIPGIVTMADRRAEAFDAIMATPKYLGVFLDGRHSMFHDRSRDAVSTEIKLRAKDITTQFLRSTLDKDQEATNLLRRRDQKLSLPIVDRWDPRYGS